MTDIVERLRRGGVADDHGNLRFDQATIIEAADEIERLRAALIFDDSEVASGPFMRSSTGSRIR